MLKQEDKTVYVNTLLVGGHEPVYCDLTSAV